MRALSPRSAAAVGLSCSVLLIGLAGPAAAVDSATYAQQGVSATNDERTSRDRSALDADSCLQRFAVRQAKKQAKADRMFHQALGPILKKCGMDHVGENVAYGFENGNDVVDAWMGSSEHRANILDRRVKKIGFAARQSDDGTWYVAQVFGRPA